MRLGPRTPSNFPRRNTTPRSYYRNTRIEPIRYTVTIMPGMKPNSWYFHLVAEAFKTCINEECWHQGSAAAARERKKCGSSLAYPHGSL